MIDTKRFPEESGQTRRLDKFIDSVMFSSGIRRAKEKLLRIDAKALNHFGLRFR